MARKKNTIFIAGGVITFIFALLLITMFSMQSYTVITDRDINFPLYSSASCIPRADHMQELDIDTITDTDTEFYYCGEVTQGKYVPQVSGVQCVYKMKQTGFNFGALDIYVCDEEYINQEQVEQNCEQEFGQADRENEFVVPAGGTLMINPTIALSVNLDLDAQIPSYGLQVEQSNGYLSDTASSCYIYELQEEGEDWYTVGQTNKLIAVPDAPFNVVTASVRGKTTHLISLEDIDNGDPIYVSRPGYYYSTFEDDEGNLYVDTRDQSSGEVYDPRIECIPRSFGCSDDAKVTSLENQQCGGFFGAPVGYTPVENDPSKMCIYDCVQGEVQRTNDCIDVQQSPCPNDEPIWDPTTGECVANAPVDDNGPRTDIDPIIFIIIGVFVVIIIGMIFVKLRMDGRI